MRYNTRMKKVRLDNLLVEQGLFEDAGQVLRAVMAREVRVDDVYVSSAAIKVLPTADIYVKNRKRYVSRGGYKLQGALDAFSQDVTGMSCIDIGSSTGGFTDCLLQAGAKSVACVDVNYGQLAWSMRQDPRTTVFERTNIKLAEPAELGAPFDLLVADLSFIGLAGLAPTFANLCAPGSIFIGLVKPQFESRHDETEGGVVRSEEVRIRTVHEVEDALAASGFECTGVVESPIKGPEGNIEYLVRAVFKGKDSSVANAFVEELIECLGADAVRLNEPMSAHTTFEVGGPADVFVLPKTNEEISAVSGLCQRYEQPLLVIGLGSDLLVSDDGIRGCVMCLTDQFGAIEIEGTTVFAQAGASNADIAAAAQKAGLAGFEPMSGIPGTIGGAAIMNAGAYDGQFADVAVSMHCLTQEGEIVELLAEDAELRYRHSLMDDKGWIVLDATLQLQQDDPAAIQARMDDLRQRREEKQPLELPSAGSTFKRPEGYFAGALIQDAGLRGFTYGGAQVSEKHCGFVVNHNHATAAEVRELIRQVQDRVEENSGVRLQPEVRMIGFEE